MKIHNCKQGSQEWLNLRLGIPTASEFDELVTPEFKARAGQGPTSYLYRKVSEKLLGFSSKTLSGGSWAMDQGTLNESVARPWFEFVSGVDVTPVGFVTTDDGRFGCSPDGLIGEDGGIEIKCPQPETHLKYVIDGVVPKEYLAQVHGSMFVTGRKWWVFLSFSRHFQPLQIRVERDEAIQARLQSALYSFDLDFQAALLKAETLKQLQGEPQELSDRSA